MVTEWSQNRTVVTGMATGTATANSRDDEPALVLSGGALLVGDVARPDLLGRPRGHQLGESPVRPRSRPPGPVRQMS
jgi:hypothetical protein